jgi:hypothetical protein
MDLQQYTFEGESSLYDFEQDMVKKFSKERKVSTKDNFKLM